MSSQTLSAKSSNASLLSIDPTPHQELPPSPPASPKPLVPQSVARLLDVLRRREQSTYHHEGEPLRHFRLSPVEYSRFLDALHADQDLWGWYQDKVRYDYNPARSLYILRMPSTTHEYFTQRVVEAILYRIRELAKEEPEIADILLKIKPGGKHARQIAGRYAVSPGLWFPALTLEVSFSQKRKELPYIVDSYIVGSCHAIRCVLDLDIEYTYPIRRQRSRTTSTTSTNKQATVSLWRPGDEIDPETGEEIGICKHILDAIPFRDRDGAALDGLLTLTLSDILPEAVFSTIPCSLQDASISISFASLTSMLDEAEGRRTLFAQPKAKNEGEDARPKKFRKRKRTPPEDLSSGREDAYQKMERVDDERSLWLDGAWEPGTTDTSERRTRRRRDGI